MSLKDQFKKIRDDYVIHQVEGIEIPEFTDGDICRRRVRFSGRVQKVGFRLEVVELSVRLGLTGWCENQPNGDVLAEFQGTAARIDFLISFMESLKRISIREKVVEEISVIPNEVGFAKR